MKREILSRKKLYLPAITVIALALTLTIIVAISSYRNIHRDRQRVNEHLLSDGMILLDAFERMAVSEILLALLDRSQWRARLQRLAEKMASEPNISYILITDEDGRAIIHSQRNRIGYYVNSSSAARGRITHEGDIFKREAFEVAMPFRPIREDLYQGTSPDHRKLIDESLIRDALAGYWVLIGLDMRRFEVARAEDLKHTVMMGAMLLIIGSASLYFIVVVQNYYLVNRTLSTMRTYIQNVVESMISGLISVDESGVVTTINLMASQIIGIDRSDAEGRHISEVLKSHNCDIESLLSSGEPVVEKEITCQSSSGYLPLSISISRLRDETDKALGAVVILRDLREIKELQEKVQRAERLASLGRLAAGVAHEIRNPLSSIRGFAQFFQGKSGSETSDAKYARAMVGEIDRLNRIIEALLDFARPAEPKFQLHSIGDVLDHAIQLVQADVDAKNVEVIKHIENGIPDVKLDRDQMVQAILNVLLNAMDVIDENGRITVSAYAKADNLQIAISDTGPGIPQENLPRIFDPFFTTRKRGTGLGLAIVHRIVENHDGEIRVNSRVGEGTTFTILLPLGSKGKENA